MVYWEGEEVVHWKGLRWSIGRGVRGRWSIGRGMRGRQSLDVETLIHVI